MAYYRTKKLFDRSILNKENASRGVIIKTFVTTDLQKAIAEHFGLRCVETLTGFKYIGAKLGKYERAISTEKLKTRPHLNPLDAPSGRDPGEVALAPSESIAATNQRDAQTDYVDLSEEETRRLRLAHSSFYVFGGEESYGYSGADFVRDKDGNGSAIMFCEVAAYAKSRNQTVDQLLDEIFATFGYFEERNGSLTFEGAEGAKKIARLVDSYAKNPPAEMLGSKVTGIRNFETETVRDVEGDEIPKEKMSIFELEDKTRIAVRPSGTEPKIKYYLFAQRRPADGAKLSMEELATVKSEVSARLDQLWNWLQADAQTRIAP
jgi:phosphoglucomutase